jgi:hypothetical protein
VGPRRRVPRELGKLGSYANVRQRRTLVQRDAEHVLASSLRETFRVNGGVHFGLASQSCRGGPRCGMEEIFGTRAMTHEYDVDETTDEENDDDE